MLIELQPGLFMKRSLTQSIIHDFLTDHWICQI
jgi:hypothetical protein